MELTAKLECLSFTCFAVFEITGLLCFNYPMFELFIIMIAMLVVLLVAVVSNVYLSLKSEALETRKLPRWGDIGIFLMAIGILLYSDLIFAISATIMGLTILLLATFYKEHKNSEVKSVIRDQEGGTEGEI